MSTRTTPYLHLVQDLSDEPVKTHHVHANENLGIIDTAIKDLQDAVENAKAIFGDLGIDVNGDPAVSAEEASASLGFSLGDTTWSDLE